MSENSIRALIVGTTGATGKALIQSLANDLRYSAIKLVQRRSTTPNYGPNPKNIERFSQHVVDFEDLDSYKDAFSNSDVCFCALGTTIKKSGKEQMRVIDHDYVLRVAELSAAAGCKEFHLVSSKKANINSPFFYFRLKGEVENDLIKKNLFDKVVIYRPSTLICNRDERRFFEEIFQFGCKMFGYGTPIHILSQAMANTSFILNSGQNPQPKVSILENEDIYKFSSIN